MSECIFLFSFFRSPSYHFFPQKQAADTAKYGPGNLFYRKTMLFLRHIICYVHPKVSGNPGGQISSIHGVERFFIGLFTKSDLTACWIRCLTLLLRYRGIFRYCYCIFAQQTEDVCTTDSIFVISVVKIRGSRLEVVQTGVAQDG